jgi:hypothetical protein
MFYRERPSSTGRLEPGCVWMPEGVIFANGSKIGADQ